MYRFYSFLFLRTLLSIFQDLYCSHKFILVNFHRPNFQIAFVFIEDFQCGFRINYGVKFFFLILLYWSLRDVIVGGFQNLFDVLDVLQRLLAHEWFLTLYCYLFACWSISCLLTLILQIVSPIQKFLTNQHYGHLFLRQISLIVQVNILKIVNTFDVLSDFIDRCIFTLDCCKPRSLQFLYFFDLFQCLLSYRTIQKAIFELCFKLRNLTLPKNVMWILIP